MKKHRSIFILIIFTLSVFIIRPAFAALDLELTQGINASLPIAITPFSNEQANAPGNQSITQIITQDLQNSGQFRVVKSSTADTVLVGEVQPLFTNQYRDSFQLLN